MKIFNLKLLVIFSLLSSACVLNLPTGNDISHGCITEEPNRNEIAGTWIADKATLEDMRVRGNYNPSVIPKLIFHEDGKLEAIDMPDWWLADFGKSYGGFESPASGSWKFYRYKESCFEVSISLPLVGTGFNLGKSRFNREPTCIMTKYLGDPDEGNEMVFVKEK